MSAPKLRFKGFNDDWEEALLTDIVHFYNGKGHEGVVDENGEYILINSKFISSDRAVFKRVSECHQKVFDDSLVMVMSDVPNGKALAKFIHIVDGKEYALNQRIGMLVFKEEFSSKFYQYPLNRNKYYLAFDSGVGQTNLRKDEVLECPIYKLSLREQTKIASFLSAVDEKISQLTQKHELLSQYKQGMMQKLFSQQIRFKADDGSEFGEWVLSELDPYIQESKDSSKIQDEYEVLTSSRRGLIRQAEYFEDSRLADRENIGFNIIQPNQITYRSRSDDGLFFFNLNELNITGIISTYYPVFTMKNGNNKFFYECLNFHKHKYIQYAVGTSQLVLSLNQLRKIKFRIPCIEEQTKIANFLSAIDEKIEVVAQQIEQAKTWKKGLLQQMFV